MSIKENLEKTIAKSGWHLTLDSIEDFVEETPNLSANELIKRALNYDLRNIGAKFLPDQVVTGKSEKFDSNCVLQLVKLRNIAAPKENEHSHSAPAMYKITLTDGSANCNALVLDDSNKINLNTPPGTKIFLTGTIKIKSNLLILNNTNFKILGGNVDHLIQKWKDAKDLAQHVRVMNLTDTAPPPWVPFGIRQTSQVDTSKKVLGQTETAEDDGSSEFSQARQAALAEANQARSKITKTFTQQAAAAAVTVSAPPVSTIPSKTSSETSTKLKGRKLRNLLYEDESEYREPKDAAKPTAITLFDVFKSKLDIKDDPEDQQKPVSSEPTNSSYNRSDQSHRGGQRGRGRGGRSARGSHFSNQTNQQQQQNEKKQVYNQDDFNYDLGDQTRLKDLEAIKKVTSNQNKQNKQSYENKVESMSRNILPASNRNETNNRNVQTGQTAPRQSNNNNNNYQKPGYTENTNFNNSNNRNYSNQNYNNTSFNNSNNNYNNSSNNFNNPTGHSNSSNNRYQNNSNFMNNNDFNYNQINQQRINNFNNNNNPNLYHQNNFNPNNYNHGNYNPNNYNPNNFNQNNFSGNGRTYYNSNNNNNRQWQ